MNPRLLTALFTLLPAAGLAVLIYSYLLHPSPGQPVRHLGAESAVGVFDQGTNSLTVQREDKAVIPLFSVKNPHLAGRQFVIEGQVTCSGVKGAGSLEMLTVLPGSGGKAAPPGPGSTGARLSGDEDWRPFQLTGDLGPEAANPERIELNATLPESGTVSVRGVRLVQELPHSWLPARATVWMGGILGGVCGLLGLVAGLLVSYRPTQIRGLKLVRAMAWMGLVFILTGFVATLQHQPWHTGYALLLTGVVMSLAGFWNFHWLARRLAAPAPQA